MAKGSKQVTLVKPAPLPSRSEVVELVADYTDLLEQGASFVDKGVAVSSGIPIDVLAVDRDGALLIVDVFDGKNSSWVAHALHHLRWVERNRALISQRYSEHEIDPDKGARIAAVVAKITEPARDALTFVENVSLSCYRVRCFTTGAERFLTLEKGPQGFAPRPSQSEKKDILAPVQLTDAEIADFLGCSG
jgi:hypothetical protein